MRTLKVSLCDGLDLVFRIRVLFDETVFTVKAIATQPSLAVHALEAATAFPCAVGPTSLLPIVPPLHAFFLDDLLQSLLPLSEHNSHGLRSLSSREVRFVENVVVGIFIVVIDVDPVIG